MDETGASDSAAASGYTVLARKYRPQTFEALIGQDALVRVLKNAFEREKIPHALLLTGVRGVGKTTTARIVAKGLNCAAADGPTITPCGVCDQCVAIAESRHVDVLEMDAASRTGIDDIREIIDSVKYRAAQGRYKVYIIDETHMLSKNAFNGLLKTLEEPPEHAKFILATTDAHKVPVTVLSRCMRFDLRRVEPERMTAHLSGICEREGVEISEDALAVIARASEGSVRDALSLLDQAIAFGGGKVDGPAARAMLGLTERTRTFQLFSEIMTGETAAALASAQALYEDGADPQAILRDLAEVCHSATLAKVAPDRLEDPSLAPAERTLSREKPVSASACESLSRSWQMLLKALEEAARAPSAMAATEMAIIRMTHVAELPSPEELVRALREADGGAGAQTPRPSGADGRGAGAPQAMVTGAGAQGSIAQSAAPAGGARSEPRMMIASAGGDGGQARAQATASPEPTPSEPEPPKPTAAPAPTVSEPPKTFEELLALIRERRDGKLQADVERFVRPGAVRGRSFEFTPTEGAPENLAARLSERLGAWTGARFVVSISDAHAGHTIAEAKRGFEDDLRSRALAHEAVQAALTAFPNAELRQVRDRFALEGPDAAEAARPDAPDDMDDLLDGDGLDDFY